MLRYALSPTRNGFTTVQEGEPLVLIHNLHGDTVSYVHVIVVQRLFWEYPQHHNTKMAARMDTAKVQGV